MYKGFYCIILITTSITLLILPQCVFVKGNEYQPPLNPYHRKESSIANLRQIEKFFPTVSIPHLTEPDDDPTSANRQQWTPIQRRDASEFRFVYERPIRSKDSKPPRPIADSAVVKNDVFDVPLRKSIQVSYPGKTTGYVVPQWSPNSANEYTLPNFIPISTPKEDSVRMQNVIPLLFNESDFQNSWIPRNIRIYTISDASTSGPDDNRGVSNILRKKPPEDPVANLVKSKFKFEMSDSPYAQLAFRNLSSSSTAVSPTALSSKRQQDIAETDAVPRNRLPEIGIEPASQFSTPEIQSVSKTPDVSYLKTGRGTQNNILGNDRDSIKNGNFKLTSVESADDLSKFRQQEKLIIDGRKLIKKISTEIPSSTMSRSDIRTAVITDDGVYFTQNLPKNEELIVGIISPQSKNPIKFQDIIDNSNPALTFSPLNSSLNIGTGTKLTNHKNSNPKILQNVIDYKNPVLTFSASNSSLNKATAVRSRNQFSKDPRGSHNDVINDVFPFRQNGDMVLSPMQHEITETISDADGHLDTTEFDASTEFITNSTENRNDVLKSEEDVNQNEHLPSPKVKKPKSVIPRKPKIRITPGLLAVILISALVFLGFLTGAMVFAFHQWKFGIPPKKPDRPMKRTPLFYPEFLDSNNFPGNTYIRNNIFLPSPQPSEERDQAIDETDSAINTDEILSTTVKKTLSTSDVSDDVIAEDQDDVISSLKEVAHSVSDIAKSQIDVTVSQGDITESQLDVTQIYGDAPKSVQE